MWTTSRIWKIQDLFTTYEVKSMDEATLSAGEFIVRDDTASNGNANNFSITINPMEIRTFRINVKNKLRRKSNTVRERFLINS